MDEVVAPPPATADLPGIGGRIRSSPEDFRVEEIPAYPADGAPDGAHVFAWLEKRGCTTDDAVRAVARALSISPRAVGVAGKKDRHAVTRQRISVPREAAAGLGAIDLPDVAVVGPIEPHRHKLRIGHLRGNRFTVVIRGVPLAPDEAQRRLAAKIEAIDRLGGIENRYGPQRFGRDGKNAGRGLDRLRRGRPRKGDIVLSAGQSLLFNHYLLARRRDGLLRTALPGDLVQRTDSGGMFVCDDPDEVTARLERGEAVLTGPMFGSRMRAPPEGSPACEREAATLAWGGIDAGRLSELGRAAPGTRRPLLVRAEGLSATVARRGDETVAIVRFALPAGSYATVLLDELYHPAPAVQAWAAE